MYGGLNIDCTGTQAIVTAARDQQLPQSEKNGDGLFRMAGEAVRQLRPFSEHHGQGTELSGSAWTLVPANTRTNAITLCTQELT
jgi:hypothetical protein